ncbi:hypothetical protein HZB96_01250 [Candidatus Gottesmanbacteria bacterium]|nr:hypothetical protein [Candidatus Gottesmanbacteria bacterium]
MPLPIDVRPTIPGAQGSPQPSVERQVDPPNPFIVRAVTGLLELTSLCIEIPGKEHRTPSGELIYTEPPTRIPCYGRDKGCPNYLSQRREEPPNTPQDPSPQQRDS